jgi:hypothetical protein
MNEAIVIRLVDGRGAVPVLSLSQDGVLLESDGDCWPRPASIECYPDAEVTRIRMRWLRERYGWDCVRWNASVAGGCLVVAGVVSDGLPPGLYRLRLRVAELGLPQDLCRVEVKDGKSAEVELRVRDDGRRVELTRVPAAFDPAIRRVIEAPASRLDGRAVPDWLADVGVNAERKACVLNLLAKLRSVPTPAAPLIANVRSLFFAAFDRVYVSVDPQFHRSLGVLAGDNQQSFYYEGEPLSSVHRRLIDELVDEKFEPPDARFHLESFREQGTRCMQAVVAIPLDSTARGPSAAWYADLDIDLGNPLQDVEGLVIHCGELTDPFGLTDHLDLREDLATQPAGEYLYYDVTT